ncbi:MAG: hypothetical protein HZC36_16960 [Armatimonadetes bacterium]|nr:hypothetical protein [Armatimonadota bacterium]
MRRFIKSTLGRAICNVMIMALLLPSFSFFTAGRVVAQLQQAPAWAVVKFDAKDPAVGEAAADAVQSALVKIPGIDITPKDSVVRTIASLGLQEPIRDRTSMMRLGEELRAATIVNGQVIGTRITNSGGGKRAEVILRVVVNDVASGLPVNGAAVRGSSSVRTGEAEDMTVLNEALATAATMAVTEIRTKNLPTATVLNTYEATALVNQGTRSGFKVGQELIVNRGRQQVATARVTDVEPDSAMIKIERMYLGVQPGDRVRAIFDVPVPREDFPENGGIKAAQGARKSGKTGDFTTLALVLLGVALLSKSGGFTPANELAASATMYPDFSGSPAVKLTWRKDGWVRGSQTAVQWQVRRSDILGSPVMVVPGDFGFAVDDNVARDISYATFDGIGDTGTCVDSMSTTDVNVAGVTPGRPYTYTIELVYKLLAIDYPGAGNDADGYCFFISKQVSAKGIATPLDRPALVSPSPNAVVSTDIPFTFISVVNPTYPITVEYILEISSDPNFPKGKVLVPVAPFTRSDTGTLSTGSVSGLLGKLSAKFGTSQTEFYWRVGAKNVADRPGPAADASGYKYIFGANRRFTLPSAPPPPQ